MIERRQLTMALAERGVKLSKRQLWRWQQEGLIAPVELVYGERQGATAYYADDTLERAEVISAALAKKRNIEYARLALWRAGFSIDIHQLMTQGIDQLWLIKRRLVEDAVQTDDPNYVMAYEEPKARYLSSALRTLHKRSGTLYSTIFYLLLAVYNADEMPAGQWLAARYDPDILRTDQKVVVAMASLVGLVGSLAVSFVGVEVRLDPYELLDEIHPHLQPDNLEDILADTDNESLLRSDHAFRELMLIINAVYGSLKPLRRQEVAPLIDTDNWPPELQALLATVFCSFMRVPALKDGIEEILKAYHALLEQK